MPNSFDTSFIPQQPLLRVEGTKSRHEPINFALVLAIILFFVVLIIAGGIYLYSRNVEERIIARSAELEDIEKSLDSEQIAEYKRIDSRIGTAKSILREHNVFSVVLDMLEQGAAKNVGLTALSYRISEKAPIVSIEGISPSYQSVYFQMETWRNAFKPLVVRADLAMISLDDTTGVVGFQANITLNNDWLKYPKVYEIYTKGKSSTEISPPSSAVRVKSTTP